MIVFARTKVATEEIAQRLEARGFAAAALNGDMVQAQRERTIARLKSGDLDILVATDVAARGLDVDRVSHVVNYDIPYDTEAYIHRIGRTGRAGRKGEAILFVVHREQGMLRSIERATRQPIEPMNLPSVAAVNDQRIVKFKEKITKALEGAGLATFRGVIEQYEQEHGVPALDIAAALARLAQGDNPLLVPDAPPAPLRPQKPDRAPFDRPQRDRPQRDRPQGDRPAASELGSPFKRAKRPEGAPSRPPEAGTTRYRLAVGHMHGVKPGNIVGAIANEAGVDSRNIGRVDIRDDHSVVDLPAGMPDNILQHLKQVWVVGQQLRIVEEGKPFDPPRKPGKLALDGDKPRFEKPRFEKPRFDKPKFKKPKFEKSKPGPKSTTTPNRKTPNRGLP
jgi:ATP-dependent RNA helicase DeaD